MSKITRSIVRPIITLIFAIVLSYGFLKGMVSAETYVPIAAVAITWWYATRDNDKASPTP